MNLSFSRMFYVAFVATAAFLFLACGDISLALAEIKIVSSAFKHEGKIPKKYTCDGENISPPLSWSGIPEGTKSLALISEDRDAPTRTWIHWVAYNLPPDTKELAEGQPRSETLPSGAKQGMTHFGSTGYGGPCPPKGTHRYFFKLYALDTVLELKPGVGEIELAEAMKDHILGERQLMGTYKRS